MPPKVKFTKEQIIDAAFQITREKGADALTAREMATVLGVSTRPIFTYYNTMEELKADVYLRAKDYYKSTVEAGLKEKIPFLGVGKAFICLAKEEPEIYKLLFLTKPSDTVGGAIDAFSYTRDLVLDSVMKIYNMDHVTANCYYGNLWMLTYGIGTLIVMGNNPYTDKDIEEIMGECSLAFCKAYKEIPGLATGDYDKDAIFRELISRN